MSKVKELYNEVKGWGLTALVFLGLGGYLSLTGSIFLGGLCLGIFLTRNWDIITTAFNKFQNQ